MSRYTKQDIMDMVEEEDVEFIRLQFVDIFGTLKNMAVTTSQLEKVLNDKCMFDGAAIEGMDDHVGHLFLVPDLDTFTIIPWRPQQGKVARLLCDVRKENGESFEADSRNVLKKVIKKASKLGYTLDVGSECEFYLFDTDENGEPTTKTREKGAYFDIGPLDQGQNARREMVMFLEEMGFEVESSYHSRAVAQHEIDFKSDDALRSADNIATFKMVVRTTARRHGYHATFMPKPLCGVNGSGMHLTFKLYDQMGRNVFTDREKENKISDIAYYFTAGILEHIKGMTLLNNPIINSYKRLVKGYNAPVEVNWSESARDTLVRIESASDGGTQLILRSPDAASNPYLVIAACLAAGLEGIEKKKTSCIKDNKERVEILPSNLECAIQEFEKDTFIRDVVGKQIATKLVERKKKEWDEYCKQVSNWEIEQYLYRI
ncbi:glutamine synthetase family protein [[Clostridium] polysaccharolyticum]|uniref:glutamine synthetase family protein n=1 Tax=[Clostridium] polysaccharolyticum TaxID=29364 RepID=UPI000B881F51|nr:glutamine synthetase family protein [[Clostridium] polysaccharolyticum]